MNCKNIEELRGKVARIQTDIKEQKIMMKKTLVMKVIIMLESAFVMYVIILNKSAHESDQMSTINHLLIKLKDEECCMNNEVISNLINAVHD